MKIIGYISRENKGYKWWLQAHLDLPWGLAGFAVRRLRMGTETFPGRRPRPTSIWSFREGDNFLLSLILMGQNTWTHLKLGDKTEGKKTAPSPSLVSLTTQGQAEPSCRPHGEDTALVWSQHPQGCSSIPACCGPRRLEHHLFFRSSEGRSWTPLKERLIMKISGDCVWVALGAFHHLSKVSWCEAVIGWIWFIPFSFVFSLCPWRCALSSCAWVAV